MHLLTDYIQPLTSWLHTHPHAALFITFLISLAESLAIIGSIIPGSITMTAIGILAGSGVMRIDLTFLSAMLGAIAGDGSSYALGYYFSDRLSSIWPFRNYPQWLNYGKDYFRRHGATSILIGRFFGPMRSIIPVIAGMMRMNQWHFFIANVLSAIGWSILYVLPGVLIGMASNELSPESSTRLFAIILICLIIIWVTSIVVKWSLVHANIFLQTRLHDFWIHLKHNPKFAHYAKILAPSHETNHSPTAAFIVFALICFIVSIISTTLVSHDSWVATINSPVYLFFQSIRTQFFDTFFILVSLIVSPLPLFSLVIAIAIYTIYYREWRTLTFWVSLILTSTITIWFLNLLVDTTAPSNMLRRNANPSFPVVDLTFAISLIGFLILYIKKHYQTVMMCITRSLLFILLLLAIISPIYLGDNWVISVIASCFISLTICLVHWIFYRRIEQLLTPPQGPIIIICFIFALTACFSYQLYFKKMVRTHTPHLEQYVMTDEVWWNQQRPLLPIYTTNRIGHHTGLLNIQYTGSLTTLKETLETSGWKEKSNSLIYSLLMQAGGQNPADKLPVLSQLYLNRAPTLMMTYTEKDGQNLIVLRLWRSNYHLRHHLDPLWVGSVIPVNLAKNQQHTQALMTDEDYVIKGLPGFKTKQIKIPKRCLHSLPYEATQVLLVIKEPEIR